MKTTPLHLVLVLLTAVLFGQGCKSPILAELLEAKGQVRFVDAGLFECEQGKKTPDEKSPTGYVVELTYRKFAKATKNVPPQLGTTFGMVYYVPSAFTNAACKTVYSFPPIQNPLTGKVFARLEFDSRFPPKAGFYAMVYTFAEDYEIVSGKWTFQLFADSKLIAEKTFLVPNKGAGTNKAPARKS